MILAFFSLMSETHHLEMPEPPQSGDKRFPLLFFVAAIAIIAALGFYFWPGSPKAPIAGQTQAHLPFGPAEQAYARKIQLENLALSRAENFLHQEVTTLSGELLNAGSLSLRDAELTIEFSDDLHQVVLRERRSVFGGSAVPLVSGSRREFEVSFEHLPSSWNRQPPTLRVTGIQFASTKE